MTRTRRPIAFDGKFLWNLARTAPELPCGRVIFPQMMRKVLFLPGLRGTGFFLLNQSKRLIKLETYRPGVAGFEIRCRFTFFSATLATGAAGVVVVGAFLALAGAEFWIT
ncbi:hypothetical protein BLOT_007725 [Blomia tropicalis]|nr:hypothetical protein BLOT_007725 [Blomia tropicalis]